MSYNIELRQRGGGNAIITKLTTATANVEVSNLDPLRTYEFRVQQVEGQEYTNWSSWTTFETTERVVGYNVDYRPVSTPASLTSLTNINATNVDVEDLDPATDYEFRVQADNGDITSDYTTWNEFATATIGPRTAITVTRVGTPTITTAQSKFGGAGLDLPGSSDYLLLNDPDGVFDFGTARNFTYEFWYKMKIFDNFGREFLLSSRSTTTPKPWWSLNIDNSTGEIRWIHSSPTANATITSPSTFKDTNWHHIAIQRAGNTRTLYVDGANQGTTSVTGEFNSSFDDTILLGAENNNSPPAYIDEFRVSNTARYTGDFTPQTTAHIHDTTTIALFHMDGANGSTTFTDDTGAKQGQADLTVTSTLTATVDRVRGTNLDLTTTATLNASVGKIVQANIVMSAAFAPTITVNATKTGDVLMVVSSTMAAQAARIRTVDVSLLNIVNLNIQAAKTVDVASNLNSSFDISATPARLRSTQLDINATTTLDATPLRKREFNADLAVSSVLSATSNVITDTTATLNSNATVTAQAGRIRSGVAQFNSVFTLDANAEALNDMQSDIVVRATMLASAERFVGVTANLVVDASLNATPNYTVNAYADLTAQFEITATAGDLVFAQPFDLQATFDLSAEYGLNKQAYSELTVGSSMSATPTRIKEAEALLEVTSSLTASVLKLKRSSADLTVSATLNAQAQRLRASTASLNATFGITVAATKLWIASAHLEVSSTLTATPNALYQSSATLVANSNLTANVGRLTQASANLEVTATVAASIGQIVVLRVVYTIPSERRTHTIHAEKRNYTIIGA